MKVKSLILPSASMESVISPQGRRGLRLLCHLQTCLPNKATPSCFEAESVKALKTTPKIWFSSHTPAFLLSKVELISSRLQPSYLLLLLL
jgi:hypothetical protein